jgi:hypothetical protein
VEKMAFPFTKEVVEALINKDDPESLDELFNMFLLTAGNEESLILIIQRLLTSTILNVSFNAAKVKFHEVKVLLSEEEVTGFSTWLGLNGYAYQNKAICAERFKAELMPLLEGK